MTQPSNKTEPNMRPVRGDMQAPPKFLLWGVIILFVLFVSGFFAGIWIFNNMFTTGQQVRIMGEFPIMEIFLQSNPTPSGGVLPTSAPSLSSGGNALDLLTMPISNATVTPENQPTTDAEIALPTNTPLPSNTPLPTNTPISVEGDASTESLPEQAFANVPNAHRNTGFVWAQQTWNNCGPTTITTALSFFGWQEDQVYAKNQLRPNREDKNVSPYELVNFVNKESGVRAIVRMGGTIDLLKALIAEGFPVIVERGMYFEAYDWSGHYQALVAYDDSQSGFFAYDSFLGDGSAGEGILQPYLELDGTWRHFNRTFIVIYNPEQETRLQSVMGELWDANRATEIAAEVAQAEASLNIDDAFAWHNLGTAFSALGRHEEATRAFDRSSSFGTLPWRILWYQFGLFESYHAVGRYDEIIALANANLNTTLELEESYYWRALAYQGLGETGSALSDLRKALRYNPNFEAAQIALDSMQ